MMDEALQDRFDAALQVAREAGDLAMEYYAQAKSGELATSTKGVQDWVSEADRQVEKLIRDRFTRDFPQDGFLGEETGGYSGERGLWVVDPIDGTSNFVRGLDMWSICLAYYQDGKVRLGIIYDPVHGLMYSARLGQGAYCNQEPIRVSERSLPERSLVYMGYSRSTPTDIHLAAIGHLLDARIDYRRLGSAAVALCEVAAGRAEAYFEVHLKSWDCLAGMLLVEEAGGRCTPYNNPEFIQKGGMGLASNVAMHPQLQGLIQIGGKCHQ